MFFLGAFFFRCCKSALKCCESATTWCCESACRHGAVKAPTGAGKAPLLMVGAVKAPTGLQVLQKRLLTDGAVKAPTGLQVL